MGSLYVGLMPPVRYGRRRWTGPDVHPSQLTGLPMTIRETALYRFYDWVGNLLYVGITNVPAYRFSQHSGKPWMQDAYCYAIEVYPSRSEARAAERLAIRSEDPIWNIAGVLV